MLLGKTKTTKTTTNQMFVVCCLLFGLLSHTVFSPPPTELMQQGPSFLRDSTLVNPTTSALVYPDVEVVVLASLIVLRCVCRVEYVSCSCRMISCEYFL